MTWVRTSSAASRWRITRRSRSTIRRSRQSASIRSNAAKYAFWTPDSGVSCLPMGAGRGHPWRTRKIACCVVSHPSLRRALRSCWRTVDGVFPQTRATCSTVRPIAKPDITSHSLGLRLQLAGFSNRLHAFMGMTRAACAARCAWSRGRSLNGRSLPALCGEARAGRWRGAAAIGRTRLARRWRGVHQPSDV